MTPMRKEPHAARRSRRRLGALAVGAGAALCVILVAAAAPPAKAAAAAAGSRRGPGMGQPVPTGTLATFTLPPRVEPACDWSPYRRAECTALQLVGVRRHLGVFAPGTTPKGYGPADLRDAYKLPGGALSSGETVAIVAPGGYSSAESDLAVYRKQFGLPACDSTSDCFGRVNKDGKKKGYPPKSPEGSLSQAMAVDMVSAICPSCKILLVEVDSSAAFSTFTQGVGTAVRLGALFVVDDFVFEDTTANSEEAKVYSEPGVVMTAGSAGYQLSWSREAPGHFGQTLPSAFPDVVAVGTTSLTRASNSRGWNEKVFELSGSGCSIGEMVSWRKPVWQDGDACGVNKMNDDVSAVGDPRTGVAFYDHGWSVGGGQSVADSIIASVYALAGRPAGGTFPASYPYVQSSHLFDIVEGSNSNGVKCHPALMCHAGPGYDGPSGLGTPDGITAFTSPLKTDYVAMGDSYSAGEGNAPYFEGSNTKTDQCHRSMQAYSTLVRQRGQDEPIAQVAKDGHDTRFAFIACSGAETTGVTAAAVFGEGEVKTWNANGNTDWGHTQTGLDEPLQDEQPNGLNGGTTLVTITIGGNDARFADVLTGCLIPIQRRPIRKALLTSCNSAKFKLKRGFKFRGPVDPEVLVDFEPKVIGALQAHLLKTYLAIHAKAKNAQIIVAGYPLFFPAKPTATCVAGTPGRIKLKLKPGVQETINHWGTLLNQSVQAAVGMASASGIHIHFVSPVAAFAGHELCSRDSWFHPVTSFVTSPAGFEVINPASFHPTDPGEAEYARLISGCLAGTVAC